MQTKSDFINAFKQYLNIDITPAGQWMLVNGKKTSVSEYSTHRKNNLSWEQYQDDNMAKHYLRQEQNIMILDIDGEYMDSSFFIPSLGLQVPDTFYTRTTRDDKYHFYFSHTSAQVPSRVTKILGTEVDAFTYGNIFEWHSFSPSHYVHAQTVAPVPTQLIDILQELDLPYSAPSDVTPTSHIQRYNLVTRFLQDKLTDGKQWFAFFNTIFPKEYKPSGKRKLDITHYPLSYDLFNKIAVKLTSTAELDHWEHTVPTLYKLLELWDIDPQSRQSQILMHRNILPSLPEHGAISRYSQEDDTLTFQEHLDQQTGTTTPIFRVVDRGLKYIEIDKLTQEPVPHNNSFIIDDKSAQALHPERDIISEDGKVIGWDSNVPIVYYINDPYEPQYILDDVHQRHTINLYTPSQYIRDAQAVARVPVDNIVYKTLYSGVGPRYLDYVLNYHAQVIFGRESLNMVLWMASLPTDLGGAGKSIATIELLSMISGGSIQAINEKTAMSGWGDVIASSRLISLEDMTDLSKKEWDQIYAMIKQQTSNSYKKLNMKSAAVTTQRINVSLSGSSNHRPMLPPSDRRFLCLEPAHLRGETQPLSQQDSKHIGKILRSRDIEEDVQEYVNYLFYIYNQEMSDKMSEALFERTPQTEYRSKWVGDGATNTQNIIHSISNPQELLGLCKPETTLDERTIAGLLQMVMVAYNPDTNKSAVSWKWFAEILPFILSDRYKSDVYAKHSISKMLQVDFKNVGIVYANLWKNPVSSLPDSEYMRWPADGYVFNLSDAQYEQYRTVIGDLT